jgi:hypothetical protein
VISRNTSITHSKEISAMTTATQPARSANPSGTAKRELGVVISIAAMAMVGPNVCYSAYLGLQPSTVHARPNQAGTATGSIILDSTAYYSYRVVQSGDFVLQAVNVYIGTTSNAAPNPFFAFGQTSYYASLAGNIPSVATEGQKCNATISIYSGAQLVTSATIVFVASVPKAHLATATNADGRLEVFALGRDDGSPWHNWQQTGGGWSGWGSLGGSASSIAVGQDDDGRLEVFAIGSDQAVWHKSQLTPNGPSWSGWGSLGGWVSQIAVGRNGDGRLEVFAVGESDRALWHNYQVVPNGGWSGWAALGGSWSSMAVGRNGDGRLEVFTTDANGVTYHIWQTNGWSGFSPLY